MKLRLSVCFSLRLRALLVVGVFAGFTFGCSKAHTEVRTSGSAEGVTGETRFGIPPASGVVLRGEGMGDTSDLGPVDIYEVYHLPKLRDAPYGPLGSSTRRLGMIERAKAMDLISRSGFRAWQDSVSLAALADQTRIAFDQETEFRDGKASQLNRFISARNAGAIKVTSPAIDVDEPIRVSGTGLRLDLGSATLRSRSGLPYLVAIENATGVDIRGGRFLAGKSGILINKSHRIQVSGSVLQDLDGVGVAITNSESVVVRDLNISGLKYAGIVLHQGVTHSLIEDNLVERGLGTDDLAAAILLIDREVDPVADPTVIYGPQSSRIRMQPLAVRKHPPAANLIRANHLLQNRAGGIYSAGGIKNVVTSNLIAGNAKAGIYLNDASTSNVVAANTVRRNGSRRSEADLSPAPGTINEPSGSLSGAPEAPLPGISLDSALYNIVYQNSVANNYGGGITLVRTGLFNVIGMNTLVGNAAGDTLLRHFFGIDLGSAAVGSTPSPSDTTGSRGNIVFSNLIRGPHYGGVHFGAGSDENDVLDNTILDATKWALDSASRMRNNTLNNLTNLPSRNITAGLDPYLFSAAREVADDDFTP